MVSYIGFILAFVALLSISSSSIMEKFLIVNNLNPFVLAAIVSLFSGVILCLTVFLFKCFNFNMFGDIGIKHNVAILFSSRELFIVFFILCLTCMVTRVSIFNSLNFISPFQLNIVLSTMPIVVLLLSSIINYDSISAKNVMSLILFLLAIFIQIFL